MLVAVAQGVSVVPVGGFWRRRNMAADVIYDLDMTEMDLCNGLPAVTSRRKRCSVQQPALPPSLTYEGCNALQTRQSALAADMVTRIPGPSTLAPTLGGQPAEAPAIREPHPAPQARPGACGPGAAWPGPSRRGCAPPHT